MTSPVTVLKLSPGVKCPSSATPLTNHIQDGRPSNDQVSAGGRQVAVMLRRPHGGVDCEGASLPSSQVKLVTQLEASSTQPITELEAGGQSDDINDLREGELTSYISRTVGRRGVIDLLCSSRFLTDVRPQQRSFSSTPASFSSTTTSSSQPFLLTSTPRRGEASSVSSLPSHSGSVSPCFTPQGSENGGPAPSGHSPAPPYELLFELALPRAAMLFVGRMRQVSQWLVR